MDGISTAFETGTAQDLAQATPGDSIGVVEVANGNTFITRTDGSKAPAKVGDAIFQGDTIETDADGAIGILFSDDSVFSLAEEGQMVIDEMIYDPGTQDGSASFNIAAGVFTFVSGQIAKTGVDAMVVTTPTATIGIRGTAGAVRIGKDGPDSYTLLEEGGNSPAAIQGQAADDTLLAQAPGGGGGRLGEMLITTNVGSLTLSQANATTLVSGPFSSPSAIVILPLSAVLRAYASARNALPPPPLLDTQNPDNNDQGGTEDEANAEDGVEDPNAEDVIDEAAQTAAADAFEEALANGASLEEAMDAAAEAATGSLLDGALAANPDIFGTSGSINSVMNALLNLSMGGLGTQANDPLDGGFGDGGGPTDEDSDIFGIDGPGDFLGLGPGPEGQAELDAFFDFFFDPLGDPFGDLFSDQDEEFDDIFQASASGNPTVTTFTDELIANSFTFVPNQNDILINDTSNTNTSVSLFGGAESGDFYQGGSYNDTLVFSTDISQSLKVSDVTSIDLSVFTSGSLVDLFFSGPSTTTIYTGSTGYGGDVLISDSTGDDQNWKITGGVDGSQNFMTILGGGGTDTVTLGSYSPKWCFGICIKRRPDRPLSPQHRL